MREFSIFVCLFLCVSACGGISETVVSTTKKAEITTTVAPITTFLPLSDIENDGNWILRSDLSDEFNSSYIDLKKWFLAGDPNNSQELDDSDNSAADWIGRAPGVFDPTNVTIEEGNLKLLIEWEPYSEIFPVLDEDDEVIIDDDCNCQYEKYTVGGIISRNSIQYGYAEIRAKVPSLPISSAFWMIGNHFEIDIFEMIGAPGDGPYASDTRVSYMMPTTLHNWDIGDLDENAYGEEYELPWNISKDFHVYGAEWKSDEVIFYADGEEVGRITKEEAGVVWNTEELHVWIDNEIFSWEGLPTSESLPDKFIVDYVRIWE